MRRPPLLLVVVLVACVASGALAGCGKEEGLDKDQQLSQRLLGDGFQVDLADPPGRDAVGLTGTRTETDRHLVGNEPFEALVYFTHGETLQATADRLVATSPSGTADPASLDLQSPPMSYEELGQAVDDLVRLFGADPKEAAEMLGEVHDAGEAGTGTVAELAAKDTGGGGLGVTVEVDEDTGDFTVTWHVTIGEPTS